MHRHGAESNTKRAHERSEQTADEGTLHFFHICIIYVVGSLCLLWLESHKVDLFEDIVITQPLTIPPSLSLLMELKQSTPHRKCQLLMQYVGRISREVHVGTSTLRCDDTPQIKHTCTHSIFLSFSQLKVAPPYVVTVEEEMTSHLPSARLPSGEHRRSD